MPALYFGPDSFRSEGILYVGANNTNYITSLDLSTGSRTSFPYSDFSGRRYVAVAGSDLYVPNCRRHSICGIDTLTDGTNLYVSNSHSIRKIVISTGVVTTIAGSSSSGSNDGNGTAAKFSSPAGLALNDNNVIRKVVMTTGAVTTIAGSGTAATADGSGTSASFDSPCGIAVDSNGVIYVAESSGSIRKIKFE